MNVGRFGGPRRVGLEAVDDARSKVSRMVFIVSCVRIRQ